MNINSLFFLFFWSILSTGYLIAQTDCPMQMGTNFHFFDAGIYKDLKLSSIGLFTRNDIYLEDGNDWDSGLAASMAQDDAGYPLVVPFPHPETGVNQVVAFTIGGYSHNYQTGNYVLLYEGEGTFAFANWTEATVTATLPGRIEFSIDEVNENGVHIEIRSSTAGNHVRNIRIVNTLYESNYLSQPYLPQFVDKVAPFGTLRFMDWTYTNNHPIVHWSDRSQPDFHTQQIDQSGMAWEYLINMANDLQKDVWVCVPHLANLDYITQMATLFRDQLDPNLTIYLEYSNECWNWIFQQTHWLNTAAPFPGEIGKNYGYYSLQVFSAWESIFSGQGNRLKMVLAGHDYFVIDAMEYCITQSQDGLVDMVSYPGYVALSEEDYDTLDELGAGATADQVMDMLEAQMEPNFFWMRQFKALCADAYDKEFVMYEGGQHLTPRFFGGDFPYNPALYAAQSSPRMYDFYQDILNYYKDTLEVTQFMNYVLASEQESTFGSWGLTGSYFDEAPFSPKYQSVMDFIDHCDMLSVLPVELSAFEATKQANTVTLQWEILTVQQLEKFEVQRSADGIEWHSLGSVAHRGKDTYRFIDQQPIVGTGHYRLKQIDFSGWFDYSKIVTIHFDPWQADVIVSPNPFADIINISNCSDCRIKLTDSQGQPVSVHNHYTPSLDLSELAPGLYYLQLYRGTDFVSKRIVKVR